MDNYTQFILASERVSLANRREKETTPDVITHKESTTETPIPRKFRDNIAKLQELYGDKFKNGLTISYTLQEVLQLLPRERKRVDSYTALTKYLHETRGITLTITSNKTK